MKPDPEREHVSSATETTRVPSVDEPRGFAAAPGATVVVRDEEWLVTRVEPTRDGHNVSVIGLSDLVRDTSATFSTALDDVVVSDPRATDVVADDSPRYRKSRLWLEAMLRKTPIPIADPALTTAHRALADPLPYQLKAVRQALDPDNLRPRILLADAVGLVTEQAARHGLDLRGRGPGVVRVRVVGKTKQGKTRKRVHRYRTC
jgi:hypothetical protein